MQISGIGDAIVGALPELSAALENYHAEWAPDEPGAYNVSCDVLFPSLERWLESPISSDQLRRTFSLLERLANDPDQEVHFWVNDVVSWLSQRDTWLAAAGPFLGPRVAGLVRQRQDEIEVKSRRRWWQFWR